MCNLINLKLVSFSFILLCLAISNFMHAFHTTIHGVSAEVAADQAFLSELTDDSVMLRKVRIQAEDYSMAVAKATHAANAETYRAYESALNSQEQFYFRVLDRVRAELAAVKKQLVTERIRAEMAERELVELRTRIPTSASTPMLSGKPPLAPGTPIRRRTGSGGSGISVVE
ncbi:MAG TPA: hypothetical protein VJJ81_03240 [Candidatus Babeliales bacterium]|nr:hypothetical protein [Candidatus Babeliales bacterium]